MKIKWSAFFSALSLATLVGCGSEQFGTTPQSSSSAPDPVTEYQQHSCTDFSTVKPKVDFIYMFDNTQSYHYSEQEIKNAVNSTLTRISTQFDYRIIATNLVNPNLDGKTLSNSADTSDYRVLTNSSDALPAEAINKKVIAVSELTSFLPLVETFHQERGLWRLKEFMKRHRGTQNGGTGLLRQGAYQFVVLISNKFDTEVESINASNANVGNSSVFTARLNDINTYKNQLQAPQFRLFSISARTSQCKTGWWASTYSYIKMSQQYSGSDNYDLCSGSFASIFDSINQSIQQVTVPHVYRFWPVSFMANNASMTDFTNVEVRKISPAGVSTLIPASDYTYRDNGISTPDKNILTTSPFPVQIVKGKRHFIEFSSGSEISYPDCVSIKSTSKTIYYGYLVLQRAPKPETIYVTINGRVIPQSSTNGWTYLGNTTVPNIKVAHPNSDGSENPAAPASGYIIQLNGAGNYYKSGDNVQANFIPAGI